MDRCAVTEVAAATPEVALAHFSALLRFETDCWDVHESLRGGDAAFVLVDVRGLDAWQTGHVAGAVDLGGADRCIDHRQRRH